MIQQLLASFLRVQNILYKIHRIVVIADIPQLREKTQKMRDELKMWGTLHFS
jgi:hypothetical protein